jgi:hypothetical protein
VGTKAKIKGCSGECRGRSNQVSTETSLERRRIVGGQRIRWGDIVERDPSVLYSTEEDA